MSKYTKHLFQVRCNRILKDLEDEIAYATHPFAGIPAHYSIESRFVGMNDDEDDDNYYFVIDIKSNTGQGFAGAVLRDVYSIVGEFIDYVDSSEILVSIQ